MFLDFHRTLCRWRTPPNSAPIHRHFATAVLWFSVSGTTNLFYVGSYSMPVSPKIPCHCTFEGHCALYTPIFPKNPCTGFHHCFSERPKTLISASSDHQNIHCHARVQYSRILRGNSLPRTTLPKLIPYQHGLELPPFCPSEREDIKPRSFVKHWAADCSTRV